MARQPEADTITPITSINPNTESRHETRDPGFRFGDFGRCLSVQPLEGKKTKVIDLKGKTVVPGLFEEKSRGSIEMGKAADFTVLSAEMVQIPEAEILKTRCAMTVINGEIGWEVASK